MNHRVQHLFKAFRLGLCQESHVPKIYPKHRNILQVGKVCSSQKCPIASKDQHEFAPTPCLIARTHVLQLPEHRVLFCRTRLPSSKQLNLHASFLQHSGRVGGSLNIVRPVKVRHQQNASPLINRHSYAGPSCTAREAISTMASTDCYCAFDDLRSHRKYSTLPLGPGNGDATIAFTSRPNDCANNATSTTASRRSSGERTTPP